MKQVREVIPLKVIIRPLNMKTDSFKRILPLALYGIFLCHSTQGQKIELSLQQQFLNPPAEFRVAVNSTPAQEYVDEGIAGTLLLSGAFPSKERKGKVDPSWMTNLELFNQLSEKIALAKEQGYQTWFYDEMGYPSNSAGGRVTDGHPEFEAQMVRYKSFDSSGDELQVFPEGKVIFCAAFPLTDGAIDLKKRVDLTTKASHGEFRWKPSKGIWKVCLFEQVPAEAWKYHDQARPMGNIMDRNAVARFIDITHKKLEQEIGDQIQDIFILGEMPFRFLGEHKFPIDFHFKNSTARADEFTLQPALILDGGRQTVGRGFVVSNLAVLNADAHYDLLKLYQWLGPGS
jgi:hypothetical protein